MGAFGALMERACEEALPRKLGRLIVTRNKKAEKLLKKAGKAGRKGKTAKVETLRRQAGKQLGSIAKKVRKAALSSECRVAIESLVEQRARVIAGFVF
jgi:hypothetical protein